MRKLFRFVFSRFTVIFLAIALQVAAFIAVAVYYSEYFRVINIITAVLSVFVLLTIFNRDMSADAKLPWSILVALFPLTGSVIYFFFSHNYASRAERKMFRKLPQLKLAEKNPEAPPKYLGQLSYLRAMGAPAFTDTDTQYFGCGEYFFDDYLVELEKAQRFIFLEYFIVERGKMFDSIWEVLKRKVAEGVEVRLMYDDFGSLTKVKRTFCRKINKTGIRCVRFAKLKPFVSAVYNNRDHRKITVIDGKVGYMSGLNLADEYINRTHPYGYWKDSGVKLCGNAVSTLTTMFLQMFGMATKRTENFDKYLFEDTVSAEINDERSEREAVLTEPILPEHTANELTQEEQTERTDTTEENNRSKTKGVVAPFGDGPRPIYQEQIGKNVYLNLIDQAVHDLYITTPYLIVDEAFCESLRRAAQRGVTVNILIPAVPDKKTVYAMTKQSCKKLMNAGVRVYKFSRGFVHAKSIVADGTAGVVGTINLDYRSFVHHYECGVYMYETDAVRELYLDIAETLSQSERQNTPPKLKLWEKLVCAFGSVLRPLM
ncbi:MAG: phospholipase D-like domain-containing protein [Corallococcus sp.]|nr:phospholipase D-like domain-containing protein [Corallococcus sp.]MCM1358981.1 phospholipase D-like domain-containing protein [Corallococcus sp.]MCM1394970.1 phospholipase D-like domain-containing protein [Corallococcus sp.]